MAADSDDMTAPSSPAARPGCTPAGRPLRRFRGEGRQGAEETGEGLTAARRATVFASSRQALKGRTRRPATEYGSRCSRAYRRHYRLRGQPVDGCWCLQKWQFGRGLRRLELHVGSPGSAPDLVRISSRTRAASCSALTSSGDFGFGLSQSMRFASGFMVGILAFRQSKRQPLLCGAGRQARDRPPPRGSQTGLLHHLAASPPAPVSGSTGLPPPCLTSSPEARRTHSSNAWTWLHCLNRKDTDQGWNRMDAGMAEDSSK
jgi:hypothetical protein